MKNAVVTPLLKKPNLDKNSLKNYRLVSNTVFLSKIVENIDNELHRKFQLAYKTGHSTETAMLRIKSDIMQVMDNGQAVFMMLLDLSAAFDTI